MSRHRAVRNLDLDDEMDDDYEDDDNYYDEDEDEDQDYGQDTHTVASFFGAKDVQNKPTARSGGVNLVEEVKAILGEGFSTAQIQQSLRENDNDLDSSVNWLLENGPSQAAAPPPGFKPLSSKPTVSDTPQFEFKDPSPDDIVNQARSKGKNDSTAKESLSDLLFGS
ncbi:hypothetical protein DFS34DRAFT_634687 [Phlyctochytrium arcticum]|nr:hypothetical protein DFS34DRAFT_634687 [Phlyctochytrium arcticum]